MKYDVVIVGAGIAGLSLAWTLHRHGKKVAVLERSQVAQGASVRNFGMIWPLGHPLGELRELALRSREIWLEVAKEAGFWAEQRGSLTLAYEEIEEQVLREFLESTNCDPAVGKLIPPEEIVRINPLVKQSGLRVGLHSTTELCVDPREVVHTLAAHLVKQGVDLRFGLTVATVHEGVALCTTGEEFKADQIVVCAGPDAKHLLPNSPAVAELTKCKLQMMRLRPKSTPWPRMGAHLCAGLTLGHYANFRSCPSLPELKAFHAHKWPDQTRQGIHVLVSQHRDGALTVGDSHEYGDSPNPYHSEQTDHLILTALTEFLDHSAFQITERWDGHYPTLPGQFFSWTPLTPTLHSLSLFGTGMTLSFGVAERLSRDLSRGA